MLAAVAFAMLAVRIWTYRGPRAAQPVTGPLAAGALILLGVAAGLPAAAMGLTPSDTTAVAYAVTAVAAVAVCYGIALAARPSRRALRSAAPGEATGTAVRTALVSVPLSTVAFEEIAFRGVLWGLLAQQHGPGAATVTTAALFGLWHVPPRRTPLLPVAGTVLFTAAAGLLFGWLRQETGSLLPPVALHWAVNGLGVLAVAPARR